MAYRNVTFNIDLGLPFPLSMTAGLDGALAKEDEGLHMVHDVGHEAAPAQIKQKRFCPTCDVEVAHTEIKKGRADSDGKMRVVEVDEIADLKGNVDQFTKQVNLSIHPTEGTRILPAGSMYGMKPKDATQDQAYSLLHDVISRHPEMAFLGLWTPVSRLGLYRLVAYGEALVWEEQARTERIKLTDVPLAKPSAVAQANIDAYLAQSITPYDPAAYADTYAEDLQALLDSKAALDGTFSEKIRSAGKGPKAPSGGGVDLFAALEAATAPAPPKRARKSA